MGGRKRVVVTGGAGFLGSHLCDRLLAAGHVAICVDNFHTGRRANVDHLNDHSSFELVEHDIAAPLNLDADEIFNLACPASPQHYQDDPVRTTKTSVFGAFNVLELANRTRSRVLQASTSEVYGDPLEHPQHETYHGNVNPIGPRACYDEGKRCAETLFFDFQRQYGTEIKVARIFNTYGPRMQPNDGRVVSNFIVQALRGAPITVYGEGAQTRSFCYVDDLVTGLVALMGSPPDLMGPVNLGNPGEFTVRELAKLVIDLTGSSSKMVFRPLPADDPRQRRPDISLASSALGWRPEVGLRDGLVRTISYFESLLKYGAPLEPARTAATLVNRDCYAGGIIEDTGTVEETAPLGE
ncbi:UDP-glucuronic acid decarboxylase family protein [Filomicrobium sp.]|uniref:UDP-glucuronic acid decarboxylase family protein n=1 Tax=Filomicrobium sp. TaxID=2024831 RepID=UPI0025861FA2|nr:UDP-glucuronic acid decarboxylase family protein [Filomicrobium sp.]MCV0368138.1 SDR family oxidoreductase [Filomicrobium sp.]